MRARPLRFAVVVGTVLALAGISVSAVASAGTATVTQLARHGMAVLMGNYADYKIGSSWWQAAVAQSTLESYQRAIGKDEYQSEITATFDQYRGHNFENNFADDTAWWGLAWLQEYQRTGRSMYLTVAERDADYIHEKFWNTSFCRGGVWWNTSRDVKNPIANALFLELTGWLATAIQPTSRATRSERAKYLRWAGREWDWLRARSRLIQGSLFLNGQLEKGQGCKPVAHQTYTYDQGTLIAGLAWLAQAKHDRKLLARAGRAARAAINVYTAGNGGILRDTGEDTPSFHNVHAFKGILVRDLLIYAQAAGTNSYSRFFDAQERAVQRHDSDAAHFGPSWRGLAPRQAYDSGSQASGEAAVVAALLPRG